MNTAALLQLKRVYPKHAAAYLQNGETEFTLRVKALEGKIDYIIPVQVRGSSGRHKYLVDVSKLIQTKLSGMSVDDAIKLGL